MNILAILFLSLLLVVCTSANLLRGISRVLQWETVCDEISKKDWMAMAALVSGLNETAAEELYEACLAVQLDNETRTEVFEHNCFGKTSIMVWKTFMYPANMECGSSAKSPGQCTCFARMEACSPFCFIFANAMPYPRRSTCADHMESMTCTNRTKTFHRILQKWKGQKENGSFSSSVKHPSVFRVPSKERRTPFTRRGMSQTK